MVRVGVLQSNLCPANFSYFLPTSGYDTSKTASCEFFFGPLFVYSSILIEYLFQCVVGDSSTVCHGSKYLKKWLAWLDANADVKYAGLE
jgi:hypothetical protein